MLTPAGVVGPGYVLLPGETPGVYSFPGFLPGVTLDPSGHQQGAPGAAVSVPAAPDVAQAVSAPLPASASPGALPLPPDSSSSLPLDPA